MDEGASTLDNARVLCRTCHVAKTTRDLREREVQRQRDAARAAKAAWLADKPARDAHLAAWHARKAARAAAKPARDAHLAAWRARKAARESLKVASVNPGGESPDP